MASSTACTIDATGIHTPLYGDILNYLQTQYRGIYGQDVYLENDSQDGQLLGIFALALSDVNAMAVATYNSYSPATAQGNGLSSQVKINGIQRKVPSNSTVDLYLVGQAGTIITNGYALDENNVQWLLPSTVTIPVSGDITVTATAGTAGDIQAPAGTITIIGSVTLGWQTVTNPGDAVPGAPVETDAELRLRQTLSTELPSQTLLEGTVGAIAQIAGVTRYQPYENDTDTTDANGVPPHSISIVVEGGDAQTIAQTILSKKGPGAGTYGTTQETIIDSVGIAHTVSFFRPTPAPISVRVSLQVFAGYNTNIGIEIQQNIVDYINSLAIGDDVFNGRVYLPAQLYGSADSKTYKILAIYLSRDGNPVVAGADVTIGFNEVATAQLSDVSVTIP